MDITSAAALASLQYQNALKAKPGDRGFALAAAAASAEASAGEAASLFAPNAADVALSPTSLSAASDSPGSAEVKALVTQANAQAQSSLSALLGAPSSFQDLTTAGALAKAAYQLGQSARD